MSCFPVAVIEHHEQEWVLREGWLHWELGHKGENSLTGNTKQNKLEVGQGGALSKPALVAYFPTFSSRTYFPNFPKQCYQQELNAHMPGRLGDVFFHTTLTEY